MAKVSFSVGFVNALLGVGSASGVLTDTGTNRFVLRIYGLQQASAPVATILSGSVPDTANHAVTQKNTVIGGSVITLLDLEVPSSGVVFGTAAAGVLPMGGTAWSGTTISTGGNPLYPTFFRICRFNDDGSDNPSSIRIQGDIRTADITGAGMFSTASLALNTSQTVDSFQLTIASASSY